MRQRYADLEKRYKILEEKYEKSISNRGSEPNEVFANRIEKLIEIYKQNTLKESQLLIERYRLESKEAQIDQHLKK